MDLLDEKQRLARRGAPGGRGEARQARVSSSDGGHGSSSDADGGPDDGSEALAAAGFQLPDLGAEASSREAPPAYGEHLDHLHFHQPGFEAGAEVSDDGRVNININAKTRRLADLLKPTLDSQVLVEPQPPLPPVYIPPSLGGEPGRAPPPRLNVVIQIVGSRGDVQPFVALGKVLRDTYGHRVRIATHATFRPFVEDNGLDFFNIGGDPAELMAFMVKHPGLMPGMDALRNGEISRRRRGIHEMLLGCWRSCIEAGDGMGPPPKPHPRGEPLDLSRALPGDQAREPFVADAIIANPPSFAHIHVAEKLGIPLHMVFTMPWSPTRAFPHPLANIQSSNAGEVMTNYMTYTLVEMMTWQGLGDVINRFRESALDLPPLSFIWAPGLLTRLRVPYTYCWSPALIPKPNDWGRNIDVSGFFFLNLASSYAPDPELAAFLAAGPPPVYIGFGSIVVDDPNAMTHMVFDAVRLAGVRALVSKGWGGLGTDAMSLPEGVFMLGNVPHDWLFQHVSCVVHHGGAGTTAAGIKAGKPTLVVPFFGDQPFWGAMIAQAKAGPKPIKYKDLTAEKLAEAIKFCLRPDTLEQAKRLGQRISQEQGADAGGKSFHDHLDMDSLRLSPLALAVLVDEGLLQYSDVKLYRAVEYNTEDQPPDPITAGACSLVADISSIGMAIADMPRELFGARQRASEKQAAQLSPHGDKSGKQTPASSAAASRVELSTGGNCIGPLAPAGTGRSTSRSDLGETTASSGAASQRSLPESSAVTSIGPEPRDAVAKGVRAAVPSGQLRQAPSRRDEPVAGVSIGTAVGAGRGVGRAVSAGVKSPMNFCLGLAKGFRNMPRLYNDDTVRPVEKVTDLSSGIRIAGKELGYGFFDGIAGLVTQPLRGAEKEGAPGLVKGIGKGIGGLIAKPAAGFWGLPAYMMQGVHAEVNKHFARSVHNYVMTSRVVQGKQDLAGASPEERADIVARWKSSGPELKDFYTLKRRETAADKARAGSESGATPAESPPCRPRTSWIQARYKPWEDRKKPGAPEALPGRRHAGAHLPRASSSSGGGGGGSASARRSPSEEAEYEQAIRASVGETSHGDAEEDAMVEAAMRESICIMRRRGGLPETAPRASDKDPSRGASIFDDDEYRITDDEYQSLVETAMRQSLASHVARAATPRDGGLAGLGDAATGRSTDPGPCRGGASPSGSDDEGELRRAMEASRELLQREQTRLTEEEIVLEYVKRQSLAEEEYRRQRMGEGEGNEGPSERAPRDGDGYDAEEVKRALQESLEMHQRAGSPTRGKTRLGEA